MYGITYKCETCLAFDLCNKCYLSRHLIHLNHSFKTIGLEYEPVTEDELTEEDDDDDSDDTDSDD